MEARITDLEVRVAYQDKVILDLDEVVRTFTKRVEALETELAHQRELLAERVLPIGPADQPPPHY